MQNRKNFNQNQESPAHDDLQRNIPEICQEQEAVHNPQVLSQEWEAPLA